MVCRYTVNFEIVNFSKCFLTTAPLPPPIDKFTNQLFKTVGEDLQLISMNRMGDKPSSLVKMFSLERGYNAD
jgi:hypothetical protein